MTGVMRSVARRLQLPKGFLALAGTEFWERRLPG
ncbi:hypothetical protein FHS96_001754 [Sphingomonas zeicaulis]